MEKSPAVSVIVPVYNVEIYVKQCVDSILNQTFQDFEIILVDDASPDNSIKICRELYGNNSKVKIVRHEKNLGLGPARNTGIKHARGKYVYFVDSDDFILPNALEKFYEVAEEYDAQVVHATAWYELNQDEVEPILEENLRLEVNPLQKEGFLTPDLVQRLEILWNNYAVSPMAWLHFCRKDFLEENYIEFLPLISEDNTFCFALLRYAERYYNLNHLFYVYRKRTGSIMKSKSVDKFSKGIVAMIVGSIYAGKLLDDLPHFDGYDQWREKILAAVIKSPSKNYADPFYEDLDLTPEANDSAEKTLTDFFGEKTPFVKFFFDGFHIFRLQAEELWQQNQQLSALPVFLIRDQQNMLRIMDLIRANNKKIFLAGTPMHGNLGDQAIVWGELTILKSYFPDHEVIEIPYDYLTGDFGEFFWGLGFDKFVRDTGIIFLHGGGNLGNLWLNEEQLRRKLLEKFLDNKIVIFPQSVYFTADDNGHRELEKSAKIYDAHEDLHLMLRDENSFNLAQKIFPDVHKYLLPDAATSLHGILDDVEAKREGVLFILRIDKEKVRDDKKIETLQATFRNANIPFEVIDTVINERVTTLNREPKVRAVLTKIRKSKLVITDRFHGVIFSFITRTPVIAFKSFDTKISSGIKWFENVPSIFYAEEQNLVGIEDFINRAFEGDMPFAEMNTEVKFDSREIFFNALKQIVGEPKVNSGKTPLLEFFNRLELCNNKIVFVNFMGRGYGCNPKYIAKEIRRQNLPLDLVWLVNDLDEPMPDKIRKVLYGSADSIYELATAKVIVTNTKNLLPFPSKKPGQFFIMTWHAAPNLKCVEKDVEEKLSFAYVKQSKINSKLTDLMLAGSQEQVEEIRRAFWYNGEILKCGLPRNDIFFNHSEEFIADIKKSLNVPPDNKIVMYAPTFRDNPAIFADVYKFDAAKLLEVLKKKFGGKWTLLMRFHPNIAALFAKTSFDSENIINVTKYPDMQELLVVADVLISDYSSVIYDSMILHKPVFIFAKDFDSYPKERGFKQLYFDLPFKVNRTDEELFNCIETFDAAALEPEIKHFLEMIKPFDNGHASEEVVKKIKAVVGVPEVKLVNSSTPPPVYP